jgi:predicted NUDIX family phosphoesterase
MVDPAAEVVCETVMCIEARHVVHTITTQGFVPLGEFDLQRCFTPLRIWFAPRPMAESDEKFRQVIPYIVLQCGDSVACYRRAATGGEKRLHGLLSIGLGGHISLSDVVLSDGLIDIHETIRRAAERELEEEVLIAPVVAKRSVGVIYDDSDAVSRVHIGLVQIWTVAEPVVFPADDDVAECLWVAIRDLPRLQHEMEGWSVLCATALPALLLTS